MSPKSSRMGRFETDHPSGKSNTRANIVVIPEGGAIIADEGNVPRREVVEEMLKSLPAEVRELVGRISLSTYPKTSVHSNEATSERIQQFANAVRRISEKTAQNIIALIGTIRAPDYATAVSEAVSPASMQLKSPCSGREAKSIILACAQGKPHDSSTDARSTVANAIYLSQKPELQGKAGVLYKDQLFALPGLQRTGDPTKFDSRYSEIAWKERGHWCYTEDEASHTPIGEAGVDYHLNSGVQTFDIGGEADQVVSAVRGAKEGDLKGMILRSTRAANGNLLASHAEVLEALDAEEVPGIVVSNSLSKRSANGEPYDDHPYANISHGGGLTEAEARLLMAEWLAIAQSMNMDAEDRAGFVRKKLEDHPFRN